MLSGRGGEGEPVPNAEHLAVTEEVYVSVHMSA